MQGNTKSKDETVETFFRVGRVVLMRTQQVQREHLAKPLWPEQYLNVQLAKFTFDTAEDWLELKRLQWSSWLFNSPIVEGLSVLLDCFCQAKDNHLWDKQELSPHSLLLTPFSSLPWLPVEPRCPRVRELHGPGLGLIINPGPLNQLQPSCISHCTFPPL